jgi:Tfp pilus assembly protein PilE
MMKLEKMTMKTRTLKTAPRRADAGFTAVEIAMVAAVIAILSLIVLPIFRNRVEEAKVAAAKADLSALMKAQQVVKADTDFYARLEDLDNVELLGYTSFPPNGVNKEVPYFRYQKPTIGLSPDPATRHQMTDDERAVFAGTDVKPRWRGPYIAFQNSLRYEDFRNVGINPNRDNMSRMTNGADAPIQDDPTKDHVDSRIPVDPWGNPYFFFPPTGNSADPNSSNGAYSTSAIYSMGPNGMPGDGSNNSAAAFTRAYALQNPNDPGALGSTDPDSDDLVVEF